MKMMENERICVFAVCRHNVLLISVGLVCCINVCALAIIDLLAMEG